MIKQRMAELEADGLLTWQLREIGEIARRELLAEHRHIKS